MTFTARVLSFACLSLSCGSAEEKPPAVPIGDFDAGPLPQNDAGPPLDCTTSQPDEDADYDGFTPEAGDCDDCEADVNPHALDIPNNGVDDDCEGGDAAALAEACDADGTASSADPNEAAEALGLCRWVSQRSREYGVIEARFSTFDREQPLASNLQVWFTPRFGKIPPREGSRLVVLSTGRARDTTVESFTPECDTFNSKVEGPAWTYSYAPPKGYPKSSKECDEPMDAGADAYNPVVFEVLLRTPSNAEGFAFDSMFFTYEYPYYVCSRYNDFFTVFVDPKPSGLDDENVLFDADENPIGVNSGLLRVCRKDPNSQRDIDCELGPDLLVDTGFDEDESTCVSDSDPDHDDVGGASTGWLHTEVPMRGGKLVTIRFTLWDSGDPTLDSSVVLDNFQWLFEGVDGGASTRPVTAD